MIKISEFGTLEDGVVHQIELSNSTGVHVKFISLGATIRDWIVPVGQGQRSVVLGFNQLEYYMQHSPYMGAIVGRVANRIKNARFGLNGRTFQLIANEGAHQLHGGPKGLHKQIWAFSTNENKNQVCFSLKSNDGDMGYPGDIDFRITYTLINDRLRVELSGLPDRATPIALAQHNYFNLGDTPHILNHRYFIDADRYVDLDKDLIATGDIKSVQQSKYDFRTRKTLTARDGAPLDFDINLLFPADRNMSDAVAIVDSPHGDLTLKLFSDRPGLQFYNSAITNVAALGNNGCFYGPYSGFCLEDQMVPGAMHLPQLPSIICTPEAPYQHWCEIEIGQTSVKN